MEHAIIMSQNVDARDLARKHNAAPGFEEMVARMDAVACELGLRIDQRPTGWNYLPPVVEPGISDPTEGIGVYATSRGVEINLDPWQERGRDDIADDLLAVLHAITGRVWARRKPKMPYAVLLHDWPQLRREVIEPCFQARTRAATQAVSPTARNTYGGALCVTTRIICRMPC